VGFAHETNAVTIHVADGSVVDVALTTKRDVARAVVDAIVRLRAARADLSDDPGSPSL
jgi:hypothetical protein